MTGNLTDAARALAGDLPILSMDGSTRIVYRIDEVVYKVNNGMWDEDANLTEYETIRDMGTLPDGVYIPETSIYSVDGQNVIAMQFIEGTAVAECYCIAGLEECTDMCMSNDVWETVSGYLDDTAGLNTIITENGDIYLIDLA